MRSPIVVAVLALAACGSPHHETTPATAPAPVATPAEPVAGASASGCSDTEVARVMTASFDAVERYFGQLAKVVPAWTDCEVARKDLVGLEPEANRFADQVTQTKAFLDTLSPECRDHLKQNAEANARSQQMEQRFGHLEGDIAAVLGRCKDHPGFQDAVGRGLAFPKKKT